MALIRQPVEAARGGTRGGAGAVEAYTARSRAVRGEARPGPAWRPTHRQLSTNKPSKDMTTSGRLADGDELARAVASCCWRKAWGDGLRLAAWMRQ
ncbi:hypothetical protein NDU88_001798 [Pleurodeles waltl]|uniref:Uncharacterized protein n=1 Tax=Pleurodeles waltl TaxID=8319 RepID=A0AAV7QAW5_PLEWA|nr:hypothetical protein NDU88_001798 [Pleurodeles waltl]